MKKRILLLLNVLAIFFASSAFLTLNSQVIICPEDPPPIEWPTGFNTNPVPPNNPQDPSLDPVLFGLPTGDVATLNFQDLLIGPFPFDCPILWIVTRTFTGTNSVNGQPFTCVQVFTFTDQTPPTIACPVDPPPIEWPVGFNLNPVPPNQPQDPIINPVFFGNPIPDDNCGVASLNFQDALIGPTPADCPNLWKVERTWIATDFCGLTANCVQTFTFTDFTIPEIVCPPPLTIEWGDPDQPPATGEPTATDNCDPNPSFDFTDNVIITGNCPIARIIERTWVAIDICGNTSLPCLQVINVTDLTPPVFTPPGNTTIEWPPNFNLLPVPPGVPQDPRIDPSCLPVQDQFGPAVPNWFLDLPAGQDVMQSTGEVGVNIGPVLNCALPGQNQIQVNGPVLVDRGAAADIALPTAPCPAVLNGKNDVIPTEIVEMELTGGGFTLRVGDGNGIGPGAPLPPSTGHIVGQIPGEPTLACSYFEIYFELEVPFPPFFLYNQQPLIVIDTIDRVPPQAIYVHLFPPGFCVGLFDTPVPGSGNLFASLVEAKHKTVPIPVTDNCDPLPVVTFQDVLTGPFPGNCATSLWVVERTWFAFDGCGNQSPPQVQLINMTDLTPPTADCPDPGPHLLEWPTGFNLTPVGPNTPQDPSIDPSSYGSPTNLQDNCDPNPSVNYQDVLTGPFPCGAPGQVVWRVTRTWTIVDNCGNPFQCIQIFEFIDTTPPVFTAPGNTTVEWPPNFNLLPVPPGVPQDPGIDPSCLSIEDQFGPPVPDWFLDLPAGQDVMQSTGTVGVNIGPVLNCSLPGQNQIEMSGPVLVNRGAAIDIALPTAPCPAVVNGKNDVIPTEIVEMDLVGPGFNLRVGAGNGIGPGAPLPPSTGHIVGQIPGEPTLACSYFEIFFELQVPFPPFFLYNQQPLVVIDTIDRVPPQALYVHLFPPGFCVGLFDTPVPGSGNLFASLVEAVHKTMPIPATDNCDLLPVVTFQDVLTGPFPGNCATGLWVVERSWFAVDGCGNQSPTQTQFIDMVDNTPPNVVCKNISIGLGANGDVTITPAQVFDAVNSSDNCGTVTPVSVTPNTFSCLDEGPNTVTLTAEDLCGNQATCTATVTIEDFITNIMISSTPETCAGAGDGTITISATAPGGQVKYSIDGGINFQASGLFTNLTPGNYNIVIKVFGIPAICEETAVETIAAGANPTLWYKDADNDGHSDGITQSGCVQPVGYKASGDLTTLSGDCDDSDPNTHIGAPEICDGKDNDCDGVVPANEADADGDGVRICDGDCDDADASVYPGAPEICDGEDNNCNGLVDEGLSGLTFNGNVFFTTQADVNAWPGCYSKINGSVTILGAGVNNLGPLSNLVEITGNLLIQSTGLGSMSGLGALTNVGGNVTIYFNCSLTTLNGLNALTSVGGSYFMYYNFLLGNCCAVQTLLNSGVTGAVVVFFNTVGCNSLAEVNATCPNPLIGTPGNSQQSAEFSYGKVTEHTVTVYPNPVRSILTINITAEVSNGHIELTDVTGRTLIIRRLAEGQHRYDLDVSSFNAGLYFVTVKTSGEAPVSKRIVIEQ